MTTKHAETRIHSAFLRTHEVSKRSWGVSLVWSAMAIATPLLAWGDPAGALSVEWFLAVLTLGIAAVRIALIMSRTEPQPVVALVWFFIYVTCGAVALAQLHNNLFPNLANRSYLASAQVLVLVAAAAFETGGFFRRRMNLDLNYGQRKQGCREVSVQRLKLMTVIAVVGSGYFLFTVGGPGQFFANRQALSGGLASAGLGVDGQVGRAITQGMGQVPVILVFTAWVLHYRRGVGRIRGEALLVAVLLALNVIVNNPISNARFWFLTVLIGYMFASGKLTMVRFRVVLASAAFVALVVFPYSDYFRNAGGEIKIRSVGETVATKDFDQLVMTANGLWFVDGHGQTFGKQALTDILFFVPRSAWPNKGMDTGVIIGEQLNAGTTNLSSPMWIEFYFDFGWIGVLIGFALVGAAAVEMDRRFQLARRALISAEVRVTQIIVPFVAGYSLILLRGPLLQAMSKLAILIAVCLFLGSTRKVPTHGAVDCDFELQA